MIEELPRPVRPRDLCALNPSGVPNHSTQLRCAKRKVGSRRHESERYKQKVQTTNYGPLRLKANQPPTSHSAIGNWRIKSEDPGLSTEAPRTQDREDMLAKDISGREHEERIKIQWWSGFKNQGAEESRYTNSRHNVLYEARVTKSSSKKPTRQSAADMVSTKTQSIEPNQQKVWSLKEIEAMSVQEFDKHESEISDAMQKGLISD